MGYPIAKSLLCVQNIANIPARPKFNGRPTSNVIIITEKNTILLAIKIDNRNNQLTEPNSNSAKDIKISEGNENVPTNVLIPLASVSDIRFMRPAKYLKNNSLHLTSTKIKYLPADNNGKTLC